MPLVRPWGLDSSYQWREDGCFGGPGWTPCRWHSHTVRGQRIPRELLLSAVAPSSWFLAEGELPCTAACTALAKRCFIEGPDCAGEERPCPAPVELQIMWKHGDMLRVASGCTGRSWEPEFPALISNCTLSWGRLSH